MKKEELIRLERLKRGKHIEDATCEASGQLWNKKNGDLILVRWPASCDYLNPKNENAIILKINSNPENKKTKAIVPYCQRTWQSLLSSK